MIKYKRIRRTVRLKTRIILNLGTFNKFLKGARSTKIKPTILLIKNLGYREIFFQKSFIK